MGIFYNENVSIVMRKNSEYYIKKSILTQNITKSI